MTDLVRLIYRKRISLRDACLEAGIDFEPGMQVTGYEECSHCSVWHLTKELKPDLDGLPICKICEQWYGK